MNRPATRQQRDRTFFFSMPQMRYQQAYLWLLLMSSLDIMLTYLVLFVWEGREVNPLAAAVIGSDYSGWNGAIVYKFSLVVLAIVLCEVVGRESDRLGRRLSIFSVAIATFPVVYTFALLMTNREAPLTVLIG